MEKISYLDFDLKIERAGQGYRVDVVDSPAGQASANFALPFSDLELENFVLRMSRTRRGTRRLGTPELEAARTFGGRLFESLFAGEVRGCLRSSLDAAGREGKGLRLRLRLTEVPELVDIPWEYLYSPALNRFFVLSNATPLVRYLDLPERVVPLGVQPPLRVLAMIASPRDFPSLDVEQEWEKLRGALRELEEAALVSLERLEPPTLSALQRRLRGGPCHILHFIGHGAFDEAAQDGVLLLEDRDGRGHIVSAQDLGVLLHDHNSMRLVVLNSCEGARTSRTDPFAGAAQSLVQQGIPAVVAMQFEISDDAAIAISHEFYAALAAGYPVDAALAEARKAVFTSGSGAEWGTPVLYLRTPDGRIFNLEPAPQPVNPQPAAIEQPVAAPRVVFAEPLAVPAVEPGSPRTTAPRPLSGRGLLWAFVGLVAVLALVFGLTRLLPSLVKNPAQGVVPPQQVTATVQPPPSSGPMKPLDQLLATVPRVFSSTANVYDLIAEDDGVWAATSGGLVRWKSDGTSSVFTAAEGLPFNHTRALLGITDGTIWAASNYAAVHVNPTGDRLGEIQKYSEAEGIEFGESPVLMHDTDGSVWLSSLYTERPVQRFDGSLWRPPALPIDDPALKDVNPQVSALIRAKSGALWVGLHDDGILRWDGKSWTRFATGQGVPAQKIERLLEDRGGVLWAAAGEGGLLRFKPEAGAWERNEFQRADAPVYWISQLPDDSLWASGDNFIARSDDGGKQWTLAATPDDGLRFPSAVVQDGQGHIWVATSDGVAVYEGGRWRSLRREGDLSWYSIGQLTADPDSRLWALPEYGGAPSVVDPASAKVTIPPHWPAESPDITSVAFTDGTTWAGTAGGLLRIKDGAQRLLRRADGLPDDQVRALLATVTTLWIGTDQGLAKLDLASGRISTDTLQSVAGHQVDHLALAADGAVWVSSHWGEDGANSAVERFAGTDHLIWTNGQAPLDASHVPVYELTADDKGSVWAATGRGVYRWDGQTWSQAQGAPEGNVYALLPQDGAIWMAGHSGTIDRLDAEGGWQHFRPAALTGDVLDMKIGADNALWLATQDGLLRYGP